MEINDINCAFQSVQAQCLDAIIIPVLHVVCDCAGSNMRMLAGISNVGDAQQSAL